MRIPKLIALDARRSNPYLRIGAPLALLLASTVSLSLAANRSTFRHEVDAGKIAEECRALTPPDVVRYRFEASAAVDFNVHFHRGDVVEYPVQKGRLSRDASRFVAPSSQEFCWMWTNRNAFPVSVEGELAPE